MKKTILAFMAALCLTSVWGQTAPKAIEMPLWPAGLPNTNGIDHEPEDIGQRNFAPTLYLYLPEAESATGGAVVACPGGGYGHLALAHEGHDWAPFFLERGLAFAVLKYRMPRGNREVPISDAEEAIRILRRGAEAWKINPSQVGIMGSSAGGHLATTVATHAEADARPNFQILFYPVVSLDTTITHLGSCHNFLGKTPSEELVAQFCNEKQVKAGKTPPAILLLSDDDKAVPSANSVNYYSALNAQGIPAALHIYPSGGHGWGNKPSFAYREAMWRDLSDWLKGLRLE